MSTKYGVLFTLLLACWIAEAAFSAETIKRARVVHCERAYHSNGVRAAGIEGTAEVVVAVAESGRPESVRVVEAAHPFLRQPAMLAAWLSTYSPAVVGGVAASDSVRLIYSFGKGYVQDAIPAVCDFGNREYLVNLVSNQVCLYGNWLSGTVVLRLSEDRVYLDGIRVFPPIGDFNPEFHPEFGQKEVLRSQLIFESRLFERELALQGADTEGLRSRTIRMLKKLPLVLDARIEASDAFSVATVYGDTLEFTLPNPSDADEYFRLQPQMASADDDFYGWLLRLHSQHSPKLILFAFQITSTESLGNPIALEILEFLESPALRVNEDGGYELPEYIELFGSSLRASIRKPLRVERL